MITFLLCAVLVVLAWKAADRWVDRVMAPGPPLGLGHLEHDEIIDLFARRDTTTDQVPLRTKRARLAEAESPVVFPDADAMVIDRFARAQQYARDLQDVGRHSDLVKMIGWALIVGAAATRVDYRMRDGLLALVPLYGYYFIGGILWRLTSPTWYWTPAEERVERPIPFGRMGLGLLAGMIGALFLLAIAWVIHDLVTS